MGRKIILSESGLNLVAGADVGKYFQRISEEAEGDIGYYGKFKSDMGFRYRVMRNLFDDGYLVHGTNDAFDLFDIGKLKRFKDGYGVYFTRDSYKAEEYGGEFVFMDTRGMLIVDVERTFASYGVYTPNDCVMDIERYHEMQDNVVSNREYDRLESQISELRRELNDVMMRDVSYGSFKRMSNDWFQAFESDGKIRNCISYGINRLPDGGARDISLVLRNMGIDGYNYDNIYVIVNIDKLNDHIVRDRDALIASHC